MSAPEAPNTRRESRMTLRTHQTDSAGTPFGGEKQLRVTRRRNPLDLPSSPLFWPTCRCPKCQKEETN